MFSQIVVVGARRSERQDPSAVLIIGFQSAKLCRIDPAYRPANPGIQRLPCHRRGVAAIQNRQSCMAVHDVQPPGNAKAAARAFDGKGKEMLPFKPNNPIHLMARRNDENRIVNG